MSAYIVDKNHIVYLVSAATSRTINRHGCRWFHGEKWLEITPGDYERCAEVANMLMLENIKSVSHRYPNESSATLPGPNDKAECVIKALDFARGHWDRFDAVQVLQSCNCLAYQSCEHDEWEQSEAYAFLESLKASAIHNLPGMKEAIWGAPEKSSANTISLSSLCGKVAR